MITCLHCQNKEFDGAVYCSSCGTELFSPVGANKGTENSTPSSLAQPGLNSPHFPDIDLSSNATRILLKVGNYGPPIPLVGQDEFTIGRIEQKQIILPDIDLSSYMAFENGVSRLHASILITENEVTIMDLGSANGTRLNGRKVTPNVAFPLRNEDVLFLGRLEVHVIIH